MRPARQNCRAVASCSSLMGNCSMQVRYAVKRVSNSAQYSRALLTVSGTSCAFTSSTKSFKVESVLPVEKGNDCNVESRPDSSKDNKSARKFSSLFCHVITSFKVVGGLFAIVFTFKIASCTANNFPHRNCSYGPSFLAWAAFNTAKASGNKQSLVPSMQCGHSATNSLRDDCVHPNSALLL